MINLEKSERSVSECNWILSSWCELWASEGAAKDHEKICPDYAFYICPICESGY